MSTSFPLLDLIDRPRSRRSDPLSSVRAERQMRESGALRGQAFVVLQMIKSNPGMSTKELGSIGPLDRYQVARRAPELLSAKLVRRIEVGNEDCKWWVT